MAEPVLQRITELPEGIEPLGPEVIPVVQGGNTVKIRADLIAPVRSVNGEIGDVVVPFEDAVDAEALERIAADVLLEAAIDFEADARADDDTTEINARIAGDAAVQATVTTETNRAVAAEAGLLATHNAHLSDAADAHDASAVSFSPAGALVSTDVQAALAELDGAKAPLGTLGEVVQDLIAATLQQGGNIGLVYDDGLGTLTVSVTGLTSTNISNFTEAAQDAVGAALAATATLSLAYNDGANSIAGTVLDSPTVAGATPAQLRDRATHTGTQTASTISDLTEVTQDTVGTMVLAGTNASVSYNDGAGTLTVGVTGLTSAQIGDFVEAAQDAVGATLTDTSTLDLTYNDGLGTISGAVLDSPLLGGQAGAFYLARANHTGTQAQSTITSLVADLAARALDNTVVHLTGNETKTGVLTLVPPASGSSALVLKQVTSQTAAPFRVRNIADTTDLYSINAAGNPVLSSGRLRIPNWNGATESNLLYLKIDWTNGPLGQENYVEDSFAIGFNHNGSGSAIDATKPVEYLHFESAYYQTSILGTTGFGTEIHFDVKKPGGGPVRRPWSMTYMWDTEEMGHAFSGSFTWLKSDTTTQMMALYESTKVLLLDNDAHLQVSAVSTDRASLVRVGGNASEPTFLGIAGSTQTPPLLDLRKADNSILFRVAVDGVTSVNAPLILNMNQNDGALVTAQTRATNEAFLRVRRKNGQTADLISLWDHTASDKLFALNAAGHPVLNAGRLRIPTTSGATESNLLYSAIPWTNGPLGQENYTDEVMTLGFNHGGSGSPIDPTQPTIFMQYESKFWQSFITSGLAFGSEIHFNHVRPGGLGQLQRPLSFSICHATGEILGSSAGSFTWYDSLNTVVDMQKHEGNKQFSLYQDYAFTIEPVSAAKATMYFGSGTQPQILAIAGATQTAPMVSVRKADNTEVFGIAASGAVTIPGFQLGNIDGDWSWRTAGATQLGVFDATAKTATFQQDTQIIFAPASSNRAAMYLGGSATEAAILIIEGSTQTARVLDLRFADNSSIMYTQADGLTYFKQPLVMNFTQNDGAFITGQPRSTSEPFMTIRRKNGQTADILQVWDHTASTKLWAVTSSGGVELAGGLALGAHITIIPAGTDTATMDLGGTSSESSLLARAGSTQTARLLDLRKSDNTSAVKVDPDGVTTISQPMILGFNNNDGAFITGQPLTTNQPWLIVRRKNGQTADPFQLWDHTASDKLWAIDKDGKPVWHSSNAQTTVGAAGGASALPLLPSKYFKVIGDDGATYVIPAYAAT